MKVQIEITTRCNFNCFYCAGRDMVQGDMPSGLFESILDTHISRYGVPGQVSLQGEGEPTLHEQFFAMAEWIAERGSAPYTITNGTFSRPEEFRDRFSKVGVSLDTLDPVIARKIGRPNLPRALAFIDKLRSFLEVTVYTVNIAPDVKRVSEFCETRGLRHIVQPIQTKPDYRYRYPRVPVRFKRPEPFACRYLREPVMRYYDLAGTMMPCCFIKDTAELPPVKEMQDMEHRHEMPVVCRGCHFGLIQSK